jgi:hypothetical protein
VLRDGTTLCCECWLYRYRGSWSRSRSSAFRSLIADRLACRRRAARVPVQWSHLQPSRPSLASVQRQAAVRPGVDQLEFVEVLEEGRFHHGPPISERSRSISPRAAAVDGLLSKGHGSWLLELSETTAAPRTPLPEYAGKRANRTTAAANNPVPRTHVVLAEHKLITRLHPADAPDPAQTRAPVSRGNCHAHAAGSPGTSRPYRQLRPASRRMELDPGQALKMMANVGNGAQRRENFLPKTPPAQGVSARMTV